MAKFANAKNGVSKLFTAEIISLIAAILLGVMGVMGLAAIGAAEVGESSAALITGSVALGAALIAVIIKIIAFVLQIIGLSTAAKDNKTFTNAIYVIVGGIILAVIGQFFSNSMIGSICNSLSEVVGILVMLIVLRGVGELIPNSNAVKTGEKVKMFCLIAIIAGFVCTVISQLVVAAAIVGVLAIVCYLAFYIGFLMFLAQAKRAL